MVNVKLYGTPTCAFCKVAKEFFEENAIAFEYVDVAKSPEDREYLFKKTGQMGVPVIEIGEETIVGWKRSKVEKALGIN